MSKYSDSLSNLILRGINKTGKNFKHDMGYHTDKHAVEVIDAVMEIIESYHRESFTQKEQNSLFVAAAWHDAVYVPGSVTNELDSATKFIWYHGYSETVDSDLVAELIKSTTLIDHLTADISTHDELQNILLDADLWSLQLPFDEFKYRQVLILKENSLGEDSLSKSYDFLKQFLTVRPSIYRTKYARKHWEQKARENIEKLKGL